MLCVDIKFFENGEKKLHFHTNMVTGMCGQGLSDLLTVHVIWLAVFMLSRALVLGYL